MYLGGVPRYRSLVGEDAALVTTIQEMNLLALKMFFNSLNCHASKLLEKVSGSSKNEQITTSSYHAFRRRGTLIQPDQICPLKGQFSESVL